MLFFAEKRYFQGSKSNIDYEFRKVKNMENTLLIIDGSSMLSTSYYATLPPALRFGKLTDEQIEEQYKYLLQTSDGVYTNGVYTMFKTFMKVIKATAPTHLIITWDLTRKTFRRELFKDYKATRKPTPSPLKQQFKTAQDLFKKIGVCELADQDFEADDLAGSVAKQFSNEFDNIYIITKDQDYLQLVDDNITVMLGVNEEKYQEYEKMVKDFLNYSDISEATPKGYFPFTPDTLMDVYGLTPKQIVDWKAIAGDSSDNIPGIKGIGSDTAVTLLQEFGSLKKLQEYALSDVSDKEFTERCKAAGVKRSPRKALLNDINGDHLGRLSYQLAKIKTDLKLDINEADLHWVIDKEIMKAGCERLEINIDILL